MSSMEEDFMEMNSDGYEEQYVQCSPKLPRTNNGEQYVQCSPKLPRTNNGDKICDTCHKADVCKYKEVLNKAIIDIAGIADRVNVFIDTDIRCKKWSGKVSELNKNDDEINYRLCPVVKDDIYPRCMFLRDRKYCSNQNVCNCK